MKAISRCALALTVAAWVWAAAPAHAQNIYVALLVNDQPITNFDINSRAKLLQLSRISAAKARSQAEDELINEVLQMAEAKRLNIVVSQEQIDQAFATIAQRTKLSPANFSRALRQVGVDARTLRRRLRASIAWRQVVQTRFRATVRIKEQDVVNAMLERTDKSTENKKVTEYTLKQVIFVYPKNAGKGLKEQRRREASALRSRFNSCSQSIELAKGLRDVAVKDIGRRVSTDIPAELAKTFDETPNGKLTKPRITDTGVEMIAICDKRELSSTLGAKSEVENELRNEEGQLLARRYIRDLRSDAVIVRKKKK